MKQYSVKSYWCGLFVVDALFTNCCPSMVYVSQSNQIYPV